MTHFSDKAFANRYGIVAVCAVIISLVASVLFARLDDNTAQLELTAFKFRLTQLRTLVLLKNAEHEAANTLNDGRYENQNPLSWVDDPISNYQGHLDLSIDQLKKGYWGFDPEKGVLAYRPNRFGVQYKTDQEYDERAKNQNLLRFKVTRKSARGQSSDKYALVTIEPYVLSLKPTI